MAVCLPPEVTPIGKLGGGGGGGGGKKKAALEGNFTKISFVPDLEKFYKGKKHTMV